MKFSECFCDTDVSQVSWKNMNPELWLVMENLTHIYRLSLYWIQNGLYIYNGMSLVNTKIAVI